MNKEPIVVLVDSDLETLIPLFLASRAQDLEGLAKGLSAHDLTALRGIGHDMKGTGSSFGFDAVSDMGDRIEIAAIAGDVEAITVQFAVFKDYLARVEIRYVAS